MSTLRMSRVLPAWPLLKPMYMGCAMKTSAMSAMGKFLRLSYQTALMDTEEAIGLVVFGALICVFILLVAVVL
jgi:hypothetical protein